jgi:hypothetical protein
MSTSTAATNGNQDYLKLVDFMKRVQINDRPEGGSYEIGSKN